MHLNTSSAKWRPFCHGLNMLNPLKSFILNRYHYDDVIMTTTVSLITSLTFVYWAINSDTDQRKHQSSASLAFVREIHRGPVNSPHKWPVPRKMFPFDDVIMRDSKQRWPSIKGANFGTQFEAYILRLIGFENYFRIYMQEHTINVACFWIILDMIQRIYVSRVSMKVWVQVRYKSTNKMWLLLFINDVSQRPNPFCISALFIFTTVSAEILWSSQCQRSDGKGYGYVSTRIS